MQHDSQETFYRSLMDLQPELICRFDRDTRLSYVNQSYARAFGRAPADLIGRPFLELVPREYHEDILKRLAELTPDSPALRYEHESRSDDGQLIWHEWTDRALFDDQGRLLTIQSVGRDITERRAVQAELEKSNALQELLTELSGTFINLPLEKVDQAIDHSIARLGTFIGADRLFIFSYDYQRNIGRNTFEWLSDGTAPMLERLERFPLDWLGDWPSRHQRGETIHVADVMALDRENPDYRLLAPHGVLSSMAVPMMDEGRCIGMLGMDSVSRRHSFSDAERRLMVVFADMLVNIEKRRRDLNALEESRRFLADLIDTSQAIIAVKNVDGEYTLVNRQWELTTGLGRDRVIGRTDRQLFDAETAEQFMRNDSLVIANGDIIRVEETLPAEEGTRFFESAKFPVHDHDGIITGLCAMITEVTDRRRAEAERVARESAEAADRAKSAFLSNMSHEMRTPLNAIIGFSELLGNDGSLQDGQLKQLRIIHRSAEHLLGLINDVLDFSKLEAALETLTSEPFSLRKTIEEVESMMLFRARSKGLHLDKDIHADVPDTLEGDHGKLRQVLINLIGNAVKFTDQGGIHLIIDPVETLAGEQAPGVVRLRFAVHDSGPGVPVHERKAIFDSFQQGQAGQKSGGTGLGLSISQRLVNLLGGEITVTSRQGSGACFSFEAPFSLAQSFESSMISQPVTGILTSGPVPRILAVDDNLDNLVLIRDLLQPIGFDVWLADSGHSAIEQCQKGLPDLVLLDLQMPGMDGYETAVGLRRLSGATSLPMVAVTASALVADRPRLADAGIDGYLRKPFRQRELLSLIADKLGIEYLHGECEAYQDSNGALDRAKLRVDENQRQMLMHAIRAGDMVMLEDCLQSLEAFSPETAGELRILAAQFDYPQMLRLLEACEVTG